MKYHDLLHDTISKLKSLGLEAIFPNLDYDKENKGDINTMDEKKRLATEHYKAIDNADVVYFITPGGYIGTSCKLELGYAIAKGIPIYFSEPTNDLALDCYVTKFISLDNLELFLEL